jgi:hypothetical protein
MSASKNSGGGSGSGSSGSAGGFGALIGNVIGSGLSYDVNKKAVRLERDKFNYLKSETANAKKEHASYGIPFYAGFGNLGQSAEYKSGTFHGRTLAPMGNDQIKKGSIFHANGMGSLN